MRNQVVPFTTTQIFSTTRDNQEEISVDIYQGNSNRADECINLGSLILRDIPKGKAGKVIIKVKLEVNAEGILKCAVQVGEKYKDIVLTNLFTGKDTDKISNTSVDKVEERKLKRWRAFANKLEGEARTTLNNLLDEFIAGTVPQADVIDFINAHKSREVKTIIDKRVIDM